MKRIYVIFLLVAGLVSCKNEDVLLGDKFFNKGDYNQAVEAYSEYLSLHPDHIKTLYNRGRAYEELNKYSLALKDFEEVLSLDPNHIQAHLSTAAAFYRNKSYNDAIYQCDLVLESNQSADAYLLRARARQKTGRTKEALADYNAAIALNANMGEAYFYRGTLRIYTKKKAAACADFQMAESLEVQAAKKARKDYCK